MHCGSYSVTAVVPTSAVDTGEVDMQGAMIYDRPESLTGPHAVPVDVQLVYTSLIVAVAPSLLRLCSDIEM